MPVHVDYLYKDGNLPTQIKPFFDEHKILKFHSIIFENIPVFMNKVHNIPQLLPKSVLQTIANNSPSLTNRDQEFYL